MNIARSAVSVENPPRRSLSPGVRGRKQSSCLGIERIVGNLSEKLIRAGAGKVEATLPDRQVWLAIDEEGMDGAFDALGSALARDAVVTILGKLLPIETGETGEDKCCVLLSLSMAYGRTPAKTGMRDALSAVRGFVNTQSGFLRVREGSEELRLSLYLPVLRQARSASF